MIYKGCVKPYVEFAKIIENKGEVLQITNSERWFGFYEVGITRRNIYFLRKAVFR